MSTLVIYTNAPLGTAQLAEHLASTGLQVRAERHGKGPAHWAAMGLLGGLVIEAYPASENHPAGTWVLREDKEK